MAVTQILAPNTTAANSSDVTVAAGAFVTLSLYTAAGGDIPWGVTCKITKTNPSATYSVTGSMLSSVPNSVTGEARTAVTLQGPGVFRVERPDISAVTSTSVGVAQDT